MSNMRTKLDEWEVKDLEDNSNLRIYVEHYTELGYQSVPGIQVKYMGNYVTFEPIGVERLVYWAQKARETEFLMEDKSGWCTRTSM